MNFDLDWLLSLDPATLADLEFGADASCTDTTCVDGHVPAGEHPALGELLQPCPLCNTNACGDCGGLAMQPKNVSYLEYLIEALLARGLRAVLCPGCNGVLDLSTFAEVTP